jgi:uncharacterized OB-fold protein
MRWAEDGRRLQLVGQRCDACGVAFFPRTVRCTACGSADVYELALGPDAELHAVTVDRTGAVLGTPQLIGQARFAQGTFVQGIVAADVDAELSPGTPMELVPFTVPAPGGSGSLVSYAFAVKEAQ